MESFLSESALYFVPALKEFSDVEVQEFLSLIEAISKGRLRETNLTTPTLKLKKIKRADICDVDLEKFGLADSIFSKRKNSIYSVHKVGKLVAVVAHDGAKGVYSIGGTLSQAEINWLIDQVPA